MNSRLLNTSRELKNVPIRVYIPQTPTSEGENAGFASSATAAAGSFKVVQSLVQARMTESTFDLSMFCFRKPPTHFPHHVPGVLGILTTRLSSTGAPQTLGAALRGLLPKLFPSSRDPVLAKVILHGAHVPFAAPLEELMRDAAYPDGWICLVVVPLDV